MTAHVSPGSLGDKSGVGANAAPAARPARNPIWLIAAEPTLPEAYATFLQLGFTDIKLDFEDMDERRRWRRTMEAGRCLIVGDWMLQASHAFADELETPCLGVDPLHVVGTRD